MENEEKKVRRGLKDISHLFLSSSPSGEMEKSHGRPVLAVCVDSWSDCSFESNSALAKNLDLPILQVDFHVAPEHQDSQGPGPAASATFCAPAVFEELVSDGEGSLYLVDFPWNFPEIIDDLLPLASAVVVTVRPSVGSMKNAFRFLKGASCFLKEEPFIRWEETGSPWLEQLAFQWSGFVKRFLNREVIWMDALAPFKERMMNASAALVAGPEPAGNTPQQEEVLRRERQRSLHFQRDFLTTSSAEPASPEFLPPRIPFHQRACLSQEELDAFFSLACQFPSA